MHFTTRPAPQLMFAEAWRRLPSTHISAWFRGGAGHVGWGVGARVELPGDAFSCALDTLRGLAGDTPLVGFASFPFRSSGSGVLVVPRVTVSRRDGRTTVTTVTGEPFMWPQPAPATAPRGVPRAGTLSTPEWQHAVDLAIQQIRAGRLSKVVLARDEWVDFPTPPAAAAVLQRLAASNPRSFTFAVDGLVGATPELLARRFGRQVESVVLAGTTPRAAPDAVELLRRSAKDHEEHALAVDSLRSAFTGLQAEFEIRSPAVLPLPTLLHLASSLRGRLDPGVSVMDVVAALHPTAAVAGTPTAAALSVIGEVEAMDRGRYAGPVGWLDTAGDGEFGIALRCAELGANRARLFAGCGIVSDSDPTMELAESEAKLTAMRQVLCG